MSSTVKFNNHTKEEALIALWNNTDALGLGLLHSHVTPTIDDATTTLNNDLYIEYYHGKPIKTDFTDFPNLKPYGYDRDAGLGMMYKVANNLANNDKNATAQLNDSEISQLIKKADENITITYM